jgi:nicotinamide-nucleotide amidase
MCRHARRKKYVRRFLRECYRRQTCRRIAMTEQSGKVLTGGLVCYDASIKTSLLGISEDFIKQFTPESAEVTAALSERLPPLIPADMHIGVTGLTTPGGSETAQNPVGTVFADIWFNQQHYAMREVFNGSPEEVVLSAVEVSRNKSCKSCTINY